MNRKYDREWYMDRVAAIRRIIPDCGLSTDIFSGFHSETEEDHQLSLSLMEECGYDSAFMFKYSERPGTHASKHLPDDVPEEVKIRRLNEIIALQNRLSAEANARCVGKTYEVLVEGVSKRSRDQLFGRTEQNRVVVFDRGTHRVGDFVMVKVTESSSSSVLCGSSYLVLVTWVTAVIPFLNLPIIWTTSEYGSNIVCSAKYTSVTSMT